MSLWKLPSIPRWLKWGGVGSIWKLAWGLSSGILREFDHMRINQRIARVHHAHFVMLISLDHEGYHTNKNCKHAFDVDDVRCSTSVCDSSSTVVGSLNPSFSRQLVGRFKSAKTRRFYVFYARYLRLRTTSRGRYHLTYHLPSY